MDSTQDPTIQPAKPHEAAEILRRDLFFDPKSLKDRHEILVNRICTPQEPAEISHLKISRNLAEAVLKLPKPRDSSQMSKKILATLLLVLSRLHEIGGGVVSTFENPASVEPEQCGICESPIRMDSLDWARCSKGHQFGRLHIRVVTFSY